MQKFILWYGSFMVQKAGRNWQKCALLVYLILAVIGSLAISTGEAFCFRDSDRGNLGSSSFFSPIGYAVDWLAEDIPAISKAHGYSFSLLRNGFLRVFVLAGALGIAIYLGKSNFKIIINDNIPIIKDIFLLKLRI